MCLPAHMQVLWMKNPWKAGHNPESRGRDEVEVGEWDQIVWIWLLCWTIWLLRVLCVQSWQHLESSLPFFFFTGGDGGVYYWKPEEREETAFTLVLLLSCKSNLAKFGMERSQQRCWWCCPKTWGREKRWSPWSCLRRGRNHVKDSGLLQCGFSFWL